MSRWSATLVLLAALTGPAAGEEPASKAAPKAGPGARPQAEAGTPVKKVPAAMAEAERLAAEELLRASKDPLRRESAALVLGVRGSSAALPTLREALGKDANKWVRTRAAEALGMIGDPAAIPWLHSALAAEKEPRIRRTIGQALFRLGQVAGVKELVWQLKAGNQHSKAEVMLFLVGSTGQPLGQDVDAWWDFFNERGGQVGLARRPAGSPGLLALGGVLPPAPARTPLGPFLHAGRGFGWRHVSAVVLDLGPRREPVTRASMEQHERLRGRIPDGCLLLIRTGWRDVKPRVDARAPAATKIGDNKAPRSMRPATAAPTWLEPQAVAFLLQRAPRLVGVGIDAPSLDPSPETAHPARDALLAANRLALESVGDLDRLIGRGTRMIIFRQGSAPAVTLLALLP